MLEESTMPPRELTFGERAVGLTFNPGNNPEVDKAKKIMANAINQMHELREGLPPHERGRL